MHATFEHVAERISVTAGVATESITPATTLEDLALDSFLLIEMAVDLQEEFDAIFTQQELQSVVTVADLVALLNTAHAASIRARAAQPASAGLSRD